MSNSLEDLEDLNNLAEWELDKLVAEKVVKRPFRKPGHGPCCTCQECGHYHEDCVCRLSSDPYQVAKVLLPILAKMFHEDLGESIALLGKTESRLLCEWLAKVAVLATHLA